MNPSNAILASQLKKFMKAKGITYTMLGNITGVSSTAAKGWTQGVKIPAALILVLNKHYGMSIIWFYTKKGPMVGNDVVNLSDIEQMASQMSLLQGEGLALKQKIARLEGESACLREDVNALREMHKQFIAARFHTCATVAESKKSPPDKKGSKKQ